MDRLIVRMLPVQIRTSHGDELEDMLACSTRPVRDRTDVVIAAVGLRLGRATRPRLRSWGRTSGCPEQISAYASRRRADR